MPRLLVLGLAGLCGCGSSTGGAVVMRWRLFDPANGAQLSAQNMPPCRIEDPPAGIAVTVDRIELTIRDLAGHAVPCASCCASCGKFEHTTAFEIPEGIYRLSIRALACGHLVGDSPPPVQRTLLRGQISDLNVIQISIPPGTSDSGACDGGAPGDCPDAA